MIIYDKALIQVLLFSALLIMIPMFCFPAKFGMDLATGSFTYSMFEIVLYGAVFFVFRPNSSLLQLFAGAGLTFLYRVVLGTIFGILLAVIYNIDFSVALALGVSRYLPAILLHVIAAPFVMKPFFLAIVDEAAHPRGYHRREPRPSAADRENKDEVTRPFLPRSQDKPVSEMSAAAVDTGGAVSRGQDVDGFERAVRYLGEHHAVLLATVVDREGLILAHLKRGENDPERWAPFSLLFEEANEKLLQRNADDYRLEQLDMVFGSTRLVTLKIDDFNLLVLCNHEEDELLSIRIKQAADIIRKYTSERYGESLPSGMEERYVSNT